ncbi:DUF1501 domain-containing protein [Nocardioides fonticola]|uniref:DUF1501 domain-containing protein n=1 Tax=Nocardioides fonticola TaxID=450363 RepID=A0ABP7XU83_9ACTN
MTSRSNDQSGCGECSGYATSRRGFLGLGAAAGLAGVTTTMLGDVMTSAVFGAAPGERILVVLSQRGGADGLSIVVPHAESAYYAARPSIAVAKSSLLVPDSRFGLHPSLKPLLPLWSSGRMAAIQAVGMPVPNRSHFDAMVELEDAAPGSSVRAGWLNRLIGALEGPHADAFSGVASGSSLLPTSLTGPRHTLAMADAAELVLPYAGSDQAAGVAAALRSLHGGSDAVSQVGREAISVTRRGRRVIAAASTRTSYPNSDLGAALKQSAALIRADLGVRAIAVDSGGWDHHVNLSSLLPTVLGDLASSVAAFFADLGDLAERVTLVTVSEFGRRLAQNGAHGLDHGYGNAVLVLGGGVKGGYYGRWPGLSAGKQVDGDLAVTTDVRHVWGEILESRFPAVDRTKVLPNAGGLRRLGFMR